ncbi:hypothetical protein Q7A53_10980 [Halobacillus rhizosphaerae]|uniref:hypothetical protein n=1 Tax=Halobacillus rhizosphaerae TaxID=3064889 RepID=UPI00398ADBE9
MFLITVAQGGFNTADAIIQVVMFLVMLLIPAVFVFLFLMFKKQREKTKRLEAKVDQLLNQKSKNT